MKVHGQRYSGQGGQLKGGRLTENKMSLDDCLKLGSDRDSRILRCSKFRILGAENRNARHPNVNLLNEITLIHCCQYFLRHTNCTANEKFTLCPGLGNPGVFSLTFWS